MIAQVQCFPVPQIWCGGLFATVLLDFTTSPTGADFRIKTGVFQKYNETTAAFHAIYPDADGQTVWGAADYSASDPDVPMTTSPADSSYRFKDNIFQLQCPDTLNWRALFSSGADDGEIETSWGPEDSSASDPDAALSVHTDYSVRVTADGLWEFANDTNNFFYPLSPTGADGAIQEAWGAGEI
jgi:hypothetical protein